MVSGIQAVQGIMAGGQELGSCQEDLFMALENNLVLTKEVAQWVSMLQGHPEDWLQQEWAAKAHHAVTQIRDWKGSHTKAWKLLAQCLKPSDEQDPAQAHFYHGTGASGGTEASSVHSQGAGIEPGSPALQTDALPSEPPGKPLVKPRDGLKSDTLLPLAGLGSLLSQA